MGFYLRKSVSVGPFRFNLSKSGVGVSVGVPGFRVGMSPRGNYVHMGRGGVYYRTTIPGSSNAAGPAPSGQRYSEVEALGIDGVVMEEIESAETHTIVDASSAELVAEMNAKRQRKRLWPILAWASAALVIGTAMSATSSGATVLTFFAVSLIATGVAAFRDQLGKSTVVLYDLDGVATARYQALSDAFDALATCGGRWHIAASGDVSDRKYHAGASTVVRRTAIVAGRGSPPYVKTNVDVPYLPVGKQTLYFFPDKVLVFEPDTVGAVSYDTLRILTSATRFIEEESVPNDAQIVDTTWRYVNKKGGPDRRFKDNRQLPIALYEDIALSSETGLNELVQVSRLGIGQEIARTVRELARVGG